MNIHKNAVMTPKGRAHLIEQIECLGLTPAAVAAGVSVRIARKWLRRHEQGDTTLLDHNSPGLIAVRVAAMLQADHEQALGQRDMLTLSPVPVDGACPPARMPLPGHLLGR